MPCICYLISRLGSWLLCSPVVSQTQWKYPASPLRLHVGILMGMEWDGSTSCCLSQVPKKPGCSCERCSGELGVLWLFALLLSTLQGCCFGSASIFLLPARYLREHAGESSVFFKVWKQHGKLLPCMSLHGIVNLTLSSLHMEMQGVHCSPVKGVFSSGTMGVNAFSSCPAFCFWEIICTWNLHLFSIWEKKYVHPAVVLTYGNSFSSGLQAVRWMGWAELPHQSAPQGGKKGSQPQTNVYRKFSLQWISLFQWNNRRVLCCIIHASSLFWYYLWILANNRWLRPLLFWEVGRWKH